jgi:hypothetical protein
MDATDNKDAIVKPNDVVLVFRPDVVDGKWTGKFKVLLSAYGPISVEERAIEEIMGVAIMASSAVSLLEEDLDFASTLFEYSQNRFATVLEEAFSHTEIKHNGVLH